MPTVDAVICGIEVKGLRLMESRYDGFDVHHKQRFSQGTQIAYLNSSSLNDEQKKAIFGDKKVYNLAIQWPIQFDNYQNVEEEKQLETQYAPDWLTDDAADTPSEKVEEEDWEPSAYQQEILDCLLNEEDHMLVEALAGSGKTTTLVWLLKSLSKLNLIKNKKIIYLAFNKSIQEELSEKLAGTSVPAQTTHSFGFGCVKAAYGKVGLNNRLLGDAFIRAICDDNGWRYTKAGFKNARQEPEYALRSAVLELVGYIKSMAIFPTLNKSWGFSDDQKEEIRELVDIYQIEIDEKFDSHELVDFACRIITSNLPHHGDEVAEITFDDMLYYPLCLGLPVPKYDLVLTDESQDFNRCQILLIEKMVKE